MNIVIIFLKSVARIMGTILSISTKTIDNANKKIIDLELFRDEFIAKSKENITKINLEINKSEIKIKNNKRECAELNKTIVDNVQAITTCDERIESLAKLAATRDFTVDERIQMDKYQSDRRIMNMVIARSLSAIEAKTISTTRTQENIVRLNRILQENIEKTYSIQFELEELIQERETNSLEFSFDEITLGGYSMKELRDIVQSENALALAKNTTNQLLDENSSSTSKKYNVDNFDIANNDKVNDLIEKYRSGEKIEDALNSSLNKVVLETQKEYA